MTTLVSPLTGEQLESITMPADGVLWVPIVGNEPDEAGGIILESSDGYIFIGECAGTGTEWAALVDLM